VSGGGLTGPIQDQSTSSLMPGGNQSGLVPCVVIDNKDPKKAGAVKVRPLDISKQAVPDDKLNWAQPFRKDSALHGVSGPATEYIPGTLVWCTYVGGQLKVVGSEGSLTNPSGDANQDKGGKYVPKPVADGDNEGKDLRIINGYWGSKNGGILNGISEETPKHDTKGPTEHAKLESPGSYGNITALKSSFNPNTFSLGTVKFDGQKSATQFIKGLNPKNLSGAIPQALDMILELKKVKGGLNPKMIQSVGPQNLFGALQFIQKIFDPKKKDTEKNDQLQQVQDFINTVQEEEEELRPTLAPADTIDTITVVVDGGAYV